MTVLERLTGAAFSFFAAAGGDLMTIWPREVSTLSLELKELCSIFAAHYEKRYCHLSAGAALFLFFTRAKDAGPDPGRGMGFA